MFPPSLQPGPLQVALFFALCNGCQARLGAARSIRRKSRLPDRVHNPASTMNRLSSILPVAQVLVGVEATSKKRAFEEAGLLFENLHGLSRALVTDSLFARERLGSTGLGHGVAIPHGRIKGLKAPMAAVFQLAQPIGFDAPDEMPVGLLIFLLVPEAATQKHLEILSEIAELLSDSVLLLAAGQLAFVMVGFVLWRMSRSRQPTPI